MVDWGVLSTDLKVCYIVHEAAKKNEVMWLSKVVRILKGDVSNATIGKSVKKCLDLDMLRGEWQELSGKWTRVLTVSGEALNFVQDYSKELTGIPKSVTKK